MKPLPPSAKLQVRQAMQRFTRRAEAAEVRWHYSQQRPFSGYGEGPEAVHVNDCSGYVGLIYHWAMHEVGVYLADPLGYRYSGYGYTGSMIDWLRANATAAPEGKYRVGDIAIQGHSAGDTRHTIVCSCGGTRGSSWWSSHGREGGPNAVRLDYHPLPVLGVWRHPGLA